MILPWLEPVVVFVVHLRGGRFFSTTWLRLNSGGGSQPLNNKQLLELHIGMCFLRVASEKHFFFLFFLGGGLRGSCANVQCVHSQLAIGCPEIDFELKVQLFSHEKI